MTSYDENAREILKKLLWYDVPNNREPDPNDIDTLSAALKEAVEEASKNLVRCNHGILIEKNNQLQSLLSQAEEALEKIIKHLDCNDENATVIDEMGNAEQVAKEALKAIRERGER